MLNDQMLTKFVFKYTFPHKRLFVYQHFQLLMTEMKVFNKLIVNEALTGKCGLLTVHT